MIPGLVFAKLRPRLGRRKFKNVEETCVKPRRCRKLQLKLRLTLLCLVAGYSIKSHCFFAQERQAAAKAPAGSKPVHATSHTKKHVSAANSTKKSSTKKKTASRSKKSRPAPRGQRTIEASRVLEIQNALAAAGYYKEAPNGQWDDSTSKAMSDYQQNNGFRTTGKPDALSLKKLGL